MAIPFTQALKQKESCSGDNTDIDSNFDSDCEGAAAAPSDVPMASTQDGPFDKNIDKLLDRMKRDLMFELRSIQHGEKPVTGQENRNHLQQFMAKHLHSEAERRPGKDNVPSNVDDVAEHRPEAVVVEVQGMIERKPVSSILQSAAFRRQLENVIRGSINTANRRSDGGSHSPAGTSTRNQIPSPVPRRSLNRVSNHEHTETAIPPTLTRSESTESLESFSSARSSVEDDFDDFEVIPPAAVENRSVQGPLVSSNPVEAPIVPAINRPSTPLETPPDGLTWSDISRVHREELVQEISELLHSRLVSSTLESEFRATLEVLTEERVVASGSNRQAVADAIRQLPHSGIPRNDFSHLNIPPVEGDNWDNVSVTSVSAHSVPYVQTNTYLSREIQGLKAQMNEMKSMLKLTFDLQMDMQRAIRQEVAAALNRCACNGGEASATPARPSRPMNETHCLICLDKYSDSVLYQCGHMCVCYVCGQNLVSRGHNCPVCRAPIKDVIRAYKTNAD